MKIRLIKADTSKIEELANESAFTWEGMTLDDKNITELAEVFVREKLVREDTEEIIGYTWYGGTMNTMYDLHGENRYQDDLPFLSFELDSFDGSGDLNAFKMMCGARWLDDIVRNNELNEEEMFGPKRF